MDKYRITFNPYSKCYRYRIEKKVWKTKGILWWKKEIPESYWYFLRGEGANHWYDYHFYELNDAKKCLREIIRSKLFQKYGHRSIKEVKRKYKND